MQTHLITDKGYLPSIEGWRGVISIFVMMFYFYVFFSDSRLVPFAYLGVDFFFLISGFIITRQYEAAIGTHQLNFKDFLINRLARLYPIFVLGTLLFLLVNAIYIQPFYDINHPGTKAVDVGSGPTLAWNTLLQFTMLGNIGGMAMPWNGLAWTVSVAFILNLVFFLVAWKLGRIPTLAWLLTAFFSAVYLIDFSPHSLDLTFALPPLFNPTLARGLLGFSLGALIFRFHKSMPPLPAIKVHLLDIFFVVAVFVLIANYDQKFLISMDYVVVLALFPPIFIISLYRKSWINKLLSLPAFTFLGRISYSIYLLHLPLGYAYQYSPFVMELHISRPYYGMIFIGLVIVVSTATYLLIEVPLRALGKKLAKKNA